MKIKLGNFVCWRIKKLILFLLCMFFCILLIGLFDKEQWNTIFIILGLSVYAFIIQFPFIKNNFVETEFLEETDEIKVKTAKKMYSIRKSEVKNVSLKEIRYGGKWLETIGYRLIVIEKQKYVFDSILVEGDTLEEKQKMLEIKKLFD